MKRTIFYGVLGVVVGLAIAFILGANWIITASLIMSCASLGANAHMLAQHYKQEDKCNS